MRLINDPAFMPSSSPDFDKEPSMQPEVGEALFNHTSQFYAWYLSWDPSPKHHKEAFSLLSTIMQVSKVSLDGGLYLNKADEQEALMKLKELGERLMNGASSSHDISGGIEIILNRLTDHNPKARLISNSTLLEYKILIHNPIEYPSSLYDDYHTMMSRLIAKVTPSLGDLDAEKLSRELSKCFESPEPPERIIDNLNTFLDHWP